MGAGKIAFALVILLYFLAMRVSGKARQKIKMHENLIVLNPEHRNNVKSSQIFGYCLISMLPLYMGYLTISLIPVRQWYVFFATGLPGLFILIIPLHNIFSSYRFITGKKSFFWQFNFSLLIALWFIGRFVVVNIFPRLLA